MKPRRHARSTNAHARRLFPIPHGPVRTLEGGSVQRGGPVPRAPGRLRRLRPHRRRRAPGLTLLETAVVVELCRAIGRRRGRAPWLLMAGDAGQTVRPTVFDWGPLNDLLARRVGARARFQLDEHLCCPSRIAEVVKRASARYVDIEKHGRPTKQRRQDGGQHVDAHLVHVHVPSRSAAVELLERLDEADDVVVLSARNDLPAWVPERLRDSVLTPAEAKGLEYQSVCLLDPGRLLSQLGSAAQAYVVDAELDRQARRTAIDHLRVTLSRATETLVCIDVEGADEDRERSLALLEVATPYSPGRPARPLRAGRRASRGARAGAGPATPGC